MSSIVESRPVLYQYGRPVEPAWTDWATRVIGSPVTSGRPSVALYDGTPTLADKIDSGIDSLLRPDLAFGRFQLSQFAYLMIDQHQGTTRPDGSKSASVIDETAKDGEISSVTFTVKPATDIGRGGLSIAVTRNHGKGYLVQDLRVGAINPAIDTDYHHATIITSVSLGSDATCAITGDPISAELTRISTTVLPETRGLDEEGTRTGSDLKTEGRKFCERIKDWAAEVSKHDYA